MHQDLWGLRVLEVGREQFDRTPSLAQLACHLFWVVRAVLVPNAIVIGMPVGEHQVPAVRGQPGRDARTDAPSTPNTRDQDSRRHKSIVARQASPGAPASSPRAVSGKGLLHADAATLMKPGSQRRSDHRTVSGGSPEAHRAGVPAVSMSEGLSNARSRPGPAMARRSIRQRPRTSCAGRFQIDVAGAFPRHRIEP